MASRYGQHCPLALATEVLGERWTILVVMQLCEGATRFSDLQRALPKIPPSTLAARLKTLEEAALVSRKTARGSDRVEYVVSPAARELEPILCELADWGQRWARDMEGGDLDPEFLAWSIHNRIDAALMPPGRVTVEFEFTGVPRGFCERFWILKLDAGTVDVCIKHPGHEIDLRVAADLRRFVEAWRGIRSLEAEVAANRVKLEGPRELKRGFTKWMLRSLAAPVARERPGRERRTHRRSGAATG